MDGTRPSIALNTLTSYLRHATSVGTTLVLVPFILASVGKAHFGLWTLIFSALGIFELLDLAFVGAVAKTVVEGQGRGDPHRRNGVLSTLWTGQVLLAFAAMGCAGLLVYNFSWMFSIPPELQETASQVLWILAVRLILLGLPFGLFRGVLHGEQRFCQINLVQTAGCAAYALVAVIVLSRGYGIIGLAWAILGAMLLEQLTYARLVYGSVPDFRLSLLLARPKLLKEVRAFSTGPVLPDFSGLVLLRTDPLILKFFLPLPAVAIYGVALTIMAQAHLLLKQFVNGLTAKVAEFHERGDKRRVRRLLLKGTRLALIPASILTISLYFLGDAAMKGWVGPNFRGSLVILYILASTLWAGTPQMVAAGVLVAAGQHRFTARVTVFSAILNVVLSVLLMQSLGVAGVAVATLLCRVGIDLLLFLRKAFDLYQVSARRYFFYCWYPALSAGLHQAAVLAVATRLFPPTNLWVALGEGMLGGITFLLVFWCYYLKAGEKSRIKGRLPQLARTRHAT